MKKQTTRFFTLFFALICVLMPLSGCRGEDASPILTNTVTETQQNETELPKNDPPAPEENDPEGDDEAAVEKLLDLTGYTIVFPEGAVNTAEYLSSYELKDALSEFGYSLNVAEESVTLAESTKKIMVGTDDTVKGKWHNKNAFLINERANGVIQIAADTYYGYREVLSYIRSRGGIPKGADYVGNAESESMTRADDTSLRVIYYNLHAHDNWKNASGQTVYGDNAPARALRQELQCDLVRSYDADVVCLQDYAPDNFRKVVSPVLASMGYTEIAATGKTSDRRPIYYKKDRLKPIDSGCVIFTRCSNSESLKKGVSWAVFQDLETNKEFAVFNTHCTSNSGSGTPASWDAERTDNAREILEAVQGVLQKHGEIPAVIGGDFNFWDVWGIDKPDAEKDPNDKWVGQNGLPFNLLMGAGLTYASSVAEESNGLLAGETYVNSYHGFRTYDPAKRIYDVVSTNVKNNYSLDHVFLDGDLTKLAVRRYLVVEDDLTMRASDHCPVCVDFVLK